MKTKVQSGLMLGIDTGGTFTDTVLFCPQRGVCATAKALTTRDNLLHGISEAVCTVLAEMASGNIFGDITRTTPRNKKNDLRDDAKHKIDVTDVAANICLVSLSTTLATNAIVSGHGSAACLILIGQSPHFLSRASLRSAVGNDPVVFINGGHNASGEEQAPLDLEALERAVQEHAPQVSAFAVASYFAVRNPQHEKQSRACIATHSALPITCSFELSARLDAPRRALTALLNARLVPLLQEFIDAALSLLQQTGIHAPLMVVQGDGSLVSVEVALQRPVETILSGPAASILGARYLTACKRAVVSDIGGTTTDIALLEDGKPLLASDGTTVGGWRTLVEAVAVHTLGLGGDSEVQGGSGGLQLSAQRALPLSLLAHQYPHTLELLGRQIKKPVREHAARFALRLRRLDIALHSLSRSERSVWEALADGPVELDALFEHSSYERALKRLRRRELVIVAAFTPSDATHIIGVHNAWCCDAAVAGAVLLARRTVGAPLDAKLLSQQIIKLLVQRSAHAISSAAIHHEEAGAVLDWREGDYLHRRAFEEPRKNAWSEYQLKLKAPLIGIGAAATAYYDDVAKLLHTKNQSPAHASVCNAVGAVASGIVQRESALISLLADERYRVHIKDGVQDFSGLEAAATAAIARCCELATQKAQAAGAADVQVEHQRRDTVVEGFGGHKIFISCNITATAAGPPAMNSCALSQASSQAPVPCQHKQPATARSAA